MLSQFKTTFVSAVALALVMPVLPVVSHSPVLAAPLCGPLNQYATQVIDHTSAADRDDATDQAGQPNRVLGAPDRQREDFNNRGSEPGFVTVGFAPHTVIVDEPGADIRLHLVDFGTRTVGGGPSDESFYLLVSNDGSTWFSLGLRHPTSPATRQSHALDFDLATRGLSQARFVKIQNQRVNPIHYPGQHNDHEGPDIDALEILHGTNCAPTPTPTPTPSPVPECRDNKDNDGDNKEDKADPGCHTDGNVNNDDSYDRDDNDERDAQVIIIKKIVKAAQVKPTPAPIKVPVTAKTGMGLPLISVITLIGAGATAFTTRRYRA